ncbi:MAG: AsnC family transcriptional regulator, partial [Duncaniella sp.]|nr:AsnC family transcriptional regulator [Duncaniella sp.]
MARQHYDALDLKILGMLSNNARKPFLEIARETGISGAAIHQRIQKLTAAGII